MRRDALAASGGGGSPTCTTLSCRPAVMKSSSVSTLRMKLARMGLGRSCRHGAGSAERGQRSGAPLSAR